LFSYSGKVLPTLYILDLIENAPANQTLTILEESTDTEMEVTLNISLNEQLPLNTTAVDNQHRYTQVQITWNAADLAAMTGPGTFVVHGTLTDYPEISITCTVQAVTNFIINPGLEDRGTTGQQVIPPWYAAGGAKTNQTDARTGDGHVNIWDDADFTFNFFQDVTLPAGTYELSFWCMGSEGEEPTILLYAANATTSVDIEVSDPCAVTSWPNYHFYSIQFTLTEETHVRVGIRGDGQASDWAHCDDFLLFPVE
jgi:hypothetical protein